MAVEVRAQPILTGVLSILAVPPRRSVQDIRYCPKYTHFPLPDMFIANAEQGMPKISLSATKVSH
ncbi:hypothetical protein HYQ43_22775 (plasmid) [Paracoccus pantotrophus]|uniref:Uncharacterized protein n=1 Tax=Paracoccus pantotrophus TaxID=82367 RepID=A0A7H9C0B6_PARPN|nr:hypothetical protein [Paracoccus pantotrophus]QLH17050.1 hypothetical protein HYQ43_22775 [Paracoccus pantotrophus]